MTKTCRVLACLLFISILELCPADECSLENSDGPAVHHFQCAHYYNLFLKAIQKDGNELHWLNRKFFPEDGRSVHVIKMSVFISVGGITNPVQNCTRNQELPAFHFDGALWVAKWTFHLSDSALLTYIGEDVLLALDNTMTWAIYTMTTEIGGHGSIDSEHEVRLHIEKLFCIPSRDVITEVLAIFMSRIQHIAISEGASIPYDGKHKLFISEGCYINKNGKEEVVLQNISKGWWLLLCLFVLLILLVMCSINTFFQPITEYINDVSNKLEESYSIYVAVSLVTFYINLINLGAFIIGLIFNHPALNTNGSRVIFGTKISFAICIVIVSTACKSRWIGIHSIDIVHVNNLLFLYSVLVSIIPNAVLLILYPLQVISSLLLILSSVFCIIVIISHIVIMHNHDNDTPSDGHDNDTPSDGHDNDTPSDGHDNDTPSDGHDNDTPSDGHDNDTPSDGHDNDTPSDGQRYCQLLQTSFFVLIFVAFISIVIVLYLQFISRGFSLNIIEFFLSLSPSVTLTLIGRSLGRKLFKQQNPYSLMCT